MNAERWQKIKSLFDAAQELEPKKREKFLDNACGNDVELRREIENLLVLIPFPVRTCAIIGE